MPSDTKTGHVREERETLPAGAPAADRVTRVVPDASRATARVDETAVSMRDAVGYDEIACAGETALTGTLVLKHDRLFALVDPRGDMTPPGRCGLGLFLDDTRLLSHYHLEFDAGVPTLLSNETPHPYLAHIDLALDDRAFGGVPHAPTHGIHVRREILVHDRLVERLSITNYLRAAIGLGVRLAVACDFADIFEVRGWHRPTRGTFLAPRVDADAITYGYRGRDGALLQSRVRFCTPPAGADARGARWMLEIAPGERTILEWEVGAGAWASTSGDGRAAEPRGRRSFAERTTALASEYTHWRRRCARWRSDVPAFDAVLRRATDDLRALHVEVDGRSVVSAGTPWYATIFGRDSIITSLETLSLTPRIAVETLRYLASRQGEREDTFTEEQPGKILHELRRGEMARAGEVPHVPYYGSVDATPLWCVLLHETWRWTGDDALVRELLPNLERALTWIDRYGDVDGDGFVEYARTAETGLVNQGWKDSYDGVPFPDGRLPTPPIALVEVQGYVYDAKLRTAQLYERLGRGDDAARLRREAAELRERIERDFWCEELGTYALALDGEKRPLRTVTSNAGHLLWSRVPADARASRLESTLLAPDMFCGWGIRTLSSRHPVFNPMSYHDGSVWPHDNALAVCGLAHYGRAAAALPVLGGLHDAAVHMDALRLPELFCGMSRHDAARPVLYPVSCSPQAWASGALFLLLQSVLGLKPDAPHGVLHVRDPHLPPFLRALVVRDLPIGGGRVTLRFSRHRTRTLANLLAVTGAPLRVQIDLA
jgi:glycogen debranching enzyme